jgi:hypothetical protein
MGDLSELDFYIKNFLLVQPSTIFLEEFLNGQTKALNERRLKDF